MFGYIFTNVLAAAAVLYGWANPAFGLMIYWTLCVLRPNFLWFWAWPAAAPRYIFYAALSTLLGWILSGFGDWSGLRRVVWPMIGLYVYLVSGVLGWQFLAIGPDFAWDALYPQLTIGLMALLTIVLVRTERMLKIFAWVVAGSMGYLGWVFNSQYYFDGWNRIWLHGFGGIDNNGAAMIMVMGVPLCFFLALYDKRWWIKIPGFLLALSLAHVVLLTFSRGGQLGLIMVGAAIFVITLFTMPHKGRTLFLSLLLAAAILYLAGPQVRARFATITPFSDKGEMEASAASRYDTWNGALRCMAANPLGVGPRNFNLVSHKYGLPVNKSVHNLFLQTGADYGILGMCGLTLFYVGTFIQTLRAAMTATAKHLIWPRYYCTMVAVSLAGFLVCSMFIGMESVEHGFIISLVGLCTVTYVDRIAQARQAAADEGVPELLEVPVPEAEAEPA